MWTIKSRTNGGYFIHDDTGLLAGSYRDAEAGATHHAFALQANQQMREALTSCLNLIEKGFEVRIGDKWPALVPAMEDAKAKVEAILRPVCQRIEVEPADTTHRRKCLDCRGTGVEQNADECQSCRGYGYIVEQPS